MGSYNYLKSKEKLQLYSDYLPVPEEQVMAAIKVIAKRHGVRWTDAMILKELGLDRQMNRTKKKKPRINLYIDGTNLFAGQYDLFGPRRVLSFRSLLSNVKKQHAVSRVYFYASYTPRKPKRRPETFFSAEAIFYREVREIPTVSFYKGHRSPASGKEKGVDVHLAVDMVKDGFRGQYDEAVLMTGDADLIYPLEVVQRDLRLPVHAIFLANRFSLELAFKARSSTVFNYQQRFQPVDRRMPAKLKVIPIKSPTCKQVG